MSLYRMTKAPFTDKCHVCTGRIGKDQYVAEVGFEEFIHPGACLEEKFGYMERREATNKGRDNGDKANGANQGLSLVESQLSSDNDIPDSPSIDQKQKES